MGRDVTPHESDEALVGSDEVANDVAAIDECLAERRAERIVRAVVRKEDVRELVGQLIDAGICEDEEEVIERAVQSFFVAVFPPSQRRVVVVK